MSNDIYKYSECDPRVVIEKAEILRDKLDEEFEKNEDMDKDKAFELMYARFINGLKLSTGMRF